MTPQAYLVHTSRGLWEVMAVTAAQAVQTVQELAGPGVNVLRVARQGEW